MSRASASPGEASSATETTRGASDIRAPVPGSSEGVALATDPSTSPGAPSAVTDCALVSAHDASAILGYDVLSADTIARASGSCYYASQSISQSGDVSYAIVTVERLAQLRPYFIVYARRCGNVGPSSPRAAGCALAAKLARAADVESYYAIRTTVPDAVAVDRIGSAAISAGGTLYVRRGALLLEATVRRDDAFDLERSELLAKLILSRLAS